MSCKANPSSKSIKFQPMPMSVLIANLKTLPTMLNTRDSSESSDDSDSSFDKLSAFSKKSESKTIPLDSKVPLAENRSTAKLVHEKKVERTPRLVNALNTNESSVNRAYRFPRVDVLPTIEASMTTSPPATVENLQSAQKRAPFVEKKESARCLFPESTKEPVPPKESATPKETTIRSVVCPPPEPPSDASSQSNHLRTPSVAPNPSSVATPSVAPNPSSVATPSVAPNPSSVATPSLAVNASTAATPSVPVNPSTAATPSVAATPSQPQGQKNSSKIQFKTITIKGKKYMFMKKLGSGGSSEVYKVLEISSSHEYAVKCVDLATEREVARGYINEVRLLRDLQTSDRVVKLYEYEYDKANNFLRLVMEAGETDLARFLQEHQDGAPPALVLHYWEEMLRAVHQIHGHGIVHADLKPANFLLVSGRLKLIDFGIASAVSGDATSAVRSCGMGTFSYISPEALGGDGTQPFKVSFYSDVWSLGCILYSLVYGRTPFAHLPTLPKLATIRDPNHCISYPPVDNIPPSLMRALQSCLRYDAHSRPTVTELLNIKYLEHPRRQVDAIIQKLKPHITAQELDILQGKIPDTLIAKLTPHITKNELSTLLSISNVQWPYNV